LFLVNQKRLITKKTKFVKLFTNETMRGDSIQRYLRISGLTAMLLYLVVNQSFSQFYVGGNTCIDNVGVPSLAGGGCFQPTTFFDTDSTSKTWRWNFGDTTAKASNISTARFPRHQYSKTGEFTVTLIKNGSTDTLKRVVKVGNPPAQPKFNGKAKADTTVCSGKLTLNPYKLTFAPSNVKYRWFPTGDTTKNIDVDSSGCYSVEVTSPEGCSRIAQITVKYCLQKVNKPSKKDLWYFGNQGSIEFTQTPFGKPTWDSLANSGSVFGAVSNNKVLYNTIPSSGNLLNSPQSTAMVYGPQGNLLFYTDGKTLLTGDNKVVPAIKPLSDTLNGSPDATQSVLIVPKSACNECPHHQYYVFTTNSKTKMLTYSIIDMRYNNRKGAIVEKDVPVYYPVGERITGVATTDSSGFYILSHDATNNNFVVLKLDSTGLIQNTQAVGSAEKKPETQQGGFVVSPRGDKVAIAVSDSNKNYVEIYRLDRNTGKLSAPPVRVDLPPAPPRVYGVAFSPDNTKLYVTLKGDPAKGEKSYLYQLNINLPDGVQIAAKKIKIDSSKTVSFGALEFAPTNGKIYMAVDGTGLMYNIQFPDALGGPNLIGYDKPPIGGDSIAGTSRFGLPNVIKAKSKDSDDGVSAKYSNTCQNSTTVFEASPLCSPLTNKYVWDFGDGTIKETSDKQISHKYTKQGKYYIKLTIRTYEKAINTGVVQVGGILGQLLDDITIFCKESTVNDSLYIRPKPETSLPDTLYVCVLEGQVKSLNATATNGTNFTYLWRPTNETTPKIEVSGTGVYRVHVQNQEGCATDTFSVVRNGCEPQVYIPNAFTPNNDGKHDKLEIISKYVTDFELRIFNRWGEQVYFTDNPLSDSRWDGAYNGFVFAPMSYAYLIQFKAKDFPLRPKEVKRGGILVVK
jgi:gliding motility-associated-like protein